MAKHLLLLSQVAKTGIFEAILTFSCEKLRIQRGRKTSPSAVAIDSRSVRKGPLVGWGTGIDGGKLINGHKRYFAVDTLGLPVANCVTAANAHDVQAPFLPDLSPFKFDDYRN